MSQVAPKPRLLDLFAGAGGAARGYQLAGFHVTGIDNRPQPRYAGDLFIQADALNPPVDLSSFDVIHASPPCQAYSVATRDKSKHPDLVSRVRRMLHDSGRRWVMENVPGAPMQDWTIIVCGSAFGLKVRRHRLFESNLLLMSSPCRHAEQGQPVGVYGGGTGAGQKRGRKVMSSAQALEVMEMPWADRAGATQAVPPAYTEYLGAQIMDYLERTSAHPGDPL